MKRKIAAIMAADIFGYSKLVAEDEEETLRRLASYKSVMDDFIARASGRIFNTAGDAVFAEFPSAVEAVRCAIDIQESLRTRNLAYPPSRQMIFRIGITVGDVVDRDGDLLGDGVNIAARLEGLAEPGGICVSHSVYEQVANKLSVQFADIGQQQVKNIPTPIHAYVASLSSPQAQPRIPKRTKSAKMLLVAMLVSIAVFGGASGIYLTFMRAHRTEPATATPTSASISTSTTPSVVTAQNASPVSQSSSKMSGSTDPTKSYGTAETTVRAFYLALGAGNGYEANRFIIPEKRVSGPFAADAITKFYGTLSEPLRLIDVAPVGSDEFRVRYGYTAPGGRRCDGTSLVRTTNISGTYLIASIRTVSGC